MKRALVTTAMLGGALLFAARPAEAHLMANGVGTVNVVGSNVYTVLAVPVSALGRVVAVDDNHDGLLDAHELDRHEADLRAELDRRLAILDGAAQAKTVRVDLVLSLSHEGPGDRADHVVVLKHAILDAPPVDLRMRTDLFGDAPADKSFKITGTRHPDSGVETEVATLTPEAPEHAFFTPAPPVAPASRAASFGAPGSPPWALLGVATLAAAALVTKRRHRAHRAQPARAR